jgi:hypothetical protein
MIIWSVNDVYSKTRKGLKLLSEIPIEIEHQADVLGSMLKELESCIVVAPGNDELWLEEGFVNKAQPLVDRVFSKSSVTIWDDVNWYQGMDKRKDKNNVEEKFHFNDSEKNKKLVAKTIVEIATLNNFIWRLRSNTLEGTLANRLSPER